MLLPQAAAELLNTECGSAQPPLQQALAALLDADLKQVRRWRGRVDQSQWQCH